MVKCSKKLIDSLVKDIVEDTGAPDSTVRRQLIKAAEHFFKASYAWRYEFITTEFEADKDWPAIKLSSESSLRIVKVHRVFIKRCNHSDYEQELFERQYANKQCRDLLWWFSPRPDVVVLNGLLDEPKAARIELSYRPEGDLSGLPVALWNHWRFALEDGARYLIYMMPKKAWTQIKLAAYHKSLFEREISKAKAHFLHDLSVHDDFIGSAFFIGRNY